MAVDVEAETTAKYESIMREREADHELRIKELAGRYSAEIEARDQLRAGEREKDAAKEAQLNRRFEELEAQTKAIQADKAQVESDRQQRVSTLLQLCRDKRKLVETLWSSGFGVLVGLIGVGVFFALGSNSVFATVIGIICGVIGFHAVPDYIFGAFINKKGEAAFKRKAAQLGIASSADLVLVREQSEEANRSR